MGEALYFTGPSQTLSSGDKVVHGQQGEIFGPAMVEPWKDTGLAMQFQGNTLPVDCFLTHLSRLPPVRGALCRCRCCLRCQMNVHTTSLSLAAQLSLMSLYHLPTVLTSSRYLSLWR